MVGSLGSPTLSGALAVVAVCLVLALAPARAETIGVRTADMPDSWLVLYNANSPDSLAWQTWYQQQWGIPAGQFLALDTTTNEHLPDLATAQAEIITPVRDFLAANPDVEARIMGIVLGYDLPGHYDSPVQFPNTGGYSIADALQDMTDDNLDPFFQKGYNEDNPRVKPPGGVILPVNGRLTKGTDSDSDMFPNRYMVARIDGPTLADAMALTLRAKALSCPTCSLYGDYVYYDYYDPDFPVGVSDEWYWLRVAVESSDLTDVPWTEFDLDGVSADDHTPNDAFRFSIYRLYGWTVSDFDCYAPGHRVLAYHLNSFGAVTVRSTTAEGALFVPNALAAGYAAAIGCTGEPGDVTGPFPDTLLAALEQGWTLGEAYYLANPYNDAMWVLVGDPLLTLPNWFDEPPAPTPGDGDMNGDGDVNALDIQPFVEVLTGVNQDPDMRAAADLSGDGLLNDDDAFLFMAPLVHDTYDWNVLRGTGDANGDGLVNGEDIQAFVAILLNGAQGMPLRVTYGADMDGDGSISISDIPLFVSFLLQSY